MNEALKIENGLSNSAAPAVSYARAGLVSRMCGLLLIFLGLAGAAWTWRLVSVEYAYRTIKAPADERMSQDFLRTYAANLKQLVERDPTNGEVRARYANVLGRLGQYDNAIEELEVALRTQNAQNSLYFMADMYEKQGNYTEAEKIIAQGVTINPNDVDHQRARLRLLNKRFLDIKQLLRQGTKIDPEVQRQVKRDFAEAALNWAIRAPEDPNSHLFIGNFYIDPLYPLQAYRSYLIALSQLQSPQPVMIEPQMALETIRQIIQGRYARRHMNLPPLPGDR